MSFELIDARFRNEFERVFYAWSRDWWCHHTKFDMCDILWKVLFPCGVASCSASNCQNYLAFATFQVQRILGRFLLYLYISFIIIVVVTLEYDVILLKRFHLYTFYITGHYIAPYSKLMPAVFLTLLLRLSRKRLLSPLHSLHQLRYDWVDLAPSLEDAKKSILL